MIDLDDFNLKKFKEVNHPNTVSGIDYIHVSYKQCNLHPDFAISIALLFQPKFIILKGKVFVEDLFRDDLYQEYMEDDENRNRVQFWLNLLEITGVFDNLSYEDGRFIAGHIANCWNAKLRAEFGEEYALARVVHEEEFGEVFVTISPEL